MTDDTWADALGELYASAAAEVGRRRESVLRHGDLARALTEPPLGFSAPDRWNGYIPPRLVPGRDGYRVNDSPRRAALVEIAGEADRRERQGRQTEIDQSATTRNDTDHRRTA